MGEIKSVKVDNWGVFFLQKLQNFFNKTDYCDLTLQFRDNSQLKVHRLVLSACTDYFNVLEQTCEVVDDAIIMPNGLQADVVVPIVNFMYTGTLEFELKMYNRLLRTAKDMNMTVLLKLLEAHRRTMEMHPQKNQAPSSPKSRRKPAVANTMGNTAGRSLIQQQQQKRIVIGGNVPQQPQQQQRNVPANIFTRVTSSSNTSATSLLPVKQQIGSTTFTRIKQESEQDENVGAGYTLLKKPPQQQSVVASPFEQLRKGYNNNKRPAATTFVSPPAKKPNLEDVKEFAEQQRMRKQIAAEFGDDGDYDAGIMDDDTIHNDDDDDDMGGGATVPTSASTAVQTSSVQQQHQQSEDPPGTTTIIVKHEGPDKPPTIVVKDSSNSKMNHAKIISEVLRQYPHLVNSNKNIKLKIMPNAGGQTQKIIVKKEPVEPEKAAVVASAISKLPTLSKGVEGKVQPVAPALAPSKPTKPQASTTSAAKVGVAATTNPSISPPTTAPSQKRRIDSKTMHALIALGAENTTGPWLCLRCGRNGHPISIPSYRGFRRHLINTHKEQIDPALCEHCGWRSSGKRELHFHMQLEHKVKTNLYIFPECQLCQQMCIDSDALNQHLIDSHPEENKQQCIYCNKIFPEELQLYTHMKTFHKKQALEDGIIDYSDDENTNTDLVFPPPLEDHEMDEEQVPQQQEEKKIKILSDISLPIASSIVKTDTIVSTTETVVTAGESTTSVASEEYLQEQQEHVETKFVAADGSEVILTDEQRKEILSQLNQENEGSGVVMVLNENQQYAGGETQSEQGALSHDETSQATTATNDEHEDHDSQIYNELNAVRHQATVEEDTTSQTEPEDTRELEPMDEEESQQTPEQDDGKVHHHDAALDESKESTDNLEWAENLISEHDMADEVSPTTAEISGGVELNKEVEQKDEDDKKAQEDISKKLKELAGDWSEDEEDDEEMLGGQATSKPEEREEISEKENAATEGEHELEQEEKTEPEKKVEAEVVESANTLEVVLASQPELERQNEENKESVEKEAEPIVEDDVDLALKSLHKEDEVEEDQSGTKENEDEPETHVDESLTFSTDIKESENIVQETSEKGKTAEEDVKINNDNIKDQAVVLPEENVVSSLADDEETKKDLIDMLISDNVESTGEVAETDQQMKEKEEELKDTICKEEEEEKVEDIAGSAASIATESTAKEPTIEDEFLDIAPEKAEDSKDEPAVVAASSTSTDDATCATTAPKDSVTSEERVKSLISEWGDDDEDEENADADLTANL